MKNISHPDNVDYFDDQAQRSGQGSLKCLSSQPYYGRNNGTLEITNKTDSSARSRHTDNQNMKKTHLMTYGLSYQDSEDATTFTRALPPRKSGREKHEKLISPA